MQVPRCESRGGVSPPNKPHELRMEAEWFAKKHMGSITGRKEDLCGAGYQLMHSLRDGR